MSDPSLEEFAKLYFDLSDSDRGSENSEESRVVLENNKSTALAATIVGATAGVLSYFADRIDENAQQEWLKSIHSELIKIKRLLVDVVEQIKLLQVFIDEKFIEFVNIKLSASIDAIAINNVEWRRNNDSHLQEESVKELINLELSFLQRERGIAMGYGCAHYDSIAVALRAELYLMLLLNRSPAGIKLMLRSYLQYFNQCLDYSYQKSLLKAKQNILDEIQSLKVQYPIGARWRFKIYSEEYRRGKDYCIQKVREFYTVGGNLENGFTFSIDVERETPYCDDPRKVLKFDLLRSANFIQENNQKVVSKRRAYEGAHNNYKNILVPRLSNISLAIEQVKRYIKLIEKFNL